MYPGRFASGATADEEGWTFERSMDLIAQIFEVVGVVVIIIGAVYALLHGFRVFENPARYFDVVRKEFGRPLILGLEILVAADIIKTITVDPSLEAVAVLAVLVAVRIALSFSLDVEIDGIAPWRRHQMRVAEHGEGSDAGS